MWTPGSDGCSYSGTPRVKAFGLGYIRRFGRETERPRLAWCAPGSVFGVNGQSVGWK